MKIKIKCRFCDGAGGFNNSCNYCGGEGCMKLGWIEFVLWHFAKYLKTLIRRYGE